MAYISYPFIDLAVLDGVREHLAAGDAVLVLSENLDEALLANSAGALLAGFEGPFDIVGENPELGISAKRQIRTLDFKGNPGRVSTIGLRLSGGVESRLVMVSVGSARLPGGETAIVLSWPTQDKSADSIIRSMADDSTHFAVLDKSGAVLAASGGFLALSISDFDLAQLTAQTNRETDRLVKRRLKAGSSVIPVGIGRLSDEPALFILLAIAESANAPETALDITCAVDTVLATEAHLEPASTPDISVVVVEEAELAPILMDVTSDDDQISEIGKVPDQASISPSDNETKNENIDLTPDAASQPVRFTWKIDAEGKFSYVSPELGRAIGSQAADVVGRSFKDVATVFAFDHGGEIVDLLARRDTWSGRSVLWPIAGTDMRAPVDLAALPAYDRDRKFEGFRGFGIVRIADAVVDPEGLGLALASVPDAPATKAKEDPWHGEIPAITITTRLPTARADEGNIVQLGERRSNKDKPTDANEKVQLTPIERNAFREIADRLRRDGLSSELDAKVDVPLEIQASALHETDLPIVAEHAAEFSKFDNIENYDDVAARDVSDLNHLNNISGEEILPSDTESNDRLLIELDEENKRSENNVSDIARLDQVSGEDVLTSDMESDYRLAFEPDKEIRHHHNTDDAPILSKLPVPVLIHNGSHLLYGNPAFFELTLYKSLDELEQEGGIEHLLHVSGTANNTAPSSTIVMADSKEVPVRAHLHSVRWKGEHALLLSLRPLEEAQDKSAENNQTIDRLTREVSELSSVLETATDGVVFINNDSTIRSINQSAEALFGFDPAAVSGKPFTHLLATESQKTANDYFANLAGTGVASLINDGREVIGREAHGRFIPLFMTVGKLESDSGYCVVLRDITQWKRAEEDLGAAKRAAEHASTQKSEFLARVSHEIRTPLNAIIGFSDMMSEERFGPVGNARYLEYLNDINRSGRHVLDLVNDLLDISKIEAGQQEMNFEAVGLNEALTEAVSIMQPQANRERVIIRSSFATELPEVVADLRSIKQIALNLLANAVRYTGAGGQVIISTSYELTGGVAIRVRDTGVGMSAQDIEQALKPFKQINTLKRERGDGTGLGLPLTKAMVEANRASFIISSTPGQGTLIEIMFPSTRVLAE
jgi:PAS domain S-box-containing protein